MEIFQSMLEEVKTLVQNEINNPEKRPDYMSERQLRFILAELDKMGRIKDIHLFCPYFPRGITDSWDLSDQLAVKLLKLCELYGKL